jgi:hypothetical protein
MDRLCALQTLGYSPGHGITIAACVPMVSATSAHDRHDAWHMKIGG